MKRQFILLFLLLIIRIKIFGQEIQIFSRYALLIGNEQYTDKSNILRTPVNDITDFSVLLHTDPSNEGFFWYAGHGIS
jgi:hypothetical protein